MKQLVMHNWRLNDEHAASWDTICSIKYATLNIHTVLVRALTLSSTRWQQWAQSTVEWV